MGALPVRTAPRQLAISSSNGTFFGVALARSSTRFLSGSGLCRRDRFARILLGAGRGVLIQDLVAAHEALDEPRERMDLEFVDFREMLAKQRDLDAVIIATPVQTHFELARAAKISGSRFGSSATRFRSGLEG